MKRLNIYELQPHLKLKDARSIRNWCGKNNVYIYKQGKNEFVFESNFKEVFERDFINSLKRKFGDEWESVYRLYSEGNIPALITLQQTPKLTKKTYKPDNKIVQEYLNKYRSHEKAA